MAQSLIDLPYFDWLLTGFAQGNVDLERAFGRHVHWGYWPDPTQADGTLENFADATERLSHVICDAAGIQAGMRVLDVGCGFGGTIDSLNERFSPIDLVGLNIDERQLQRARQTVLPLPGNQIEFVQGNACELPFADESFDAVIAVECIFHFPSRAAFLKEAIRVLRPGGRLALSDFIVGKEGNFLIATFARLAGELLAPTPFLFYGKANLCTIEDYAALSKEAGFQNTVNEDITAGIVPTYDILKALVKQSNGSMSLPFWSTQFIHQAQQSRALLYYVLAFTK